MSSARQKTLGIERTLRDSDKHNMFGKLPSRVSSHRVRWLCDGVHSLMSVGSKTFLYFLNPLNVCWVLPDVPLNKYLCISFLNPLNVCLSNAWKCCIFLFILFSSPFFFYLSFLFFSFFYFSFLSYFPCLLYLVFTIFSFLFLMFILSSLYFLFFRPSNPTLDENIDPSGLSHVLWPNLTHIKWKFK